MLDKVVDGLADYIRKNNLAKPVIVGHSLGGFLALAFAVKYPEVASKLVIVDSFPFTLGLGDVTPEQAKVIAGQIRQGIGGMTQGDYEAYAKAGTSTRPMVTSDADFQRLVAWSLASDRTAVADALAEMFTPDLRADLIKIKMPVLVLGSWRGNEEYAASPAVTEAAFHAQYEKLAGVEIHVNETSRHFIMWDDPKWLFAYLDKFLAPAALAFEVATIKPAPPITAAMAAAGQFHVGMKVDGARVDIGYSSLSDLIRMAYDVKPHQISAPDWIVEQKWDILAKMPDGSAPNQVPQMLQTLLAERFGLTVHRENRDSRVYGLEVAKGGAKLKESSPADDDAPLQIATNRDGNSTVTGGGHGVTKTEMHPDGSMHLVSSKMNLALLCDSLSYYLDRPVVDMTHLTGNYVIEMEFSAADLRTAAMKSGAAAYPIATADAASEPAGLSLIGSVQKLGLRLEPQQAAMETIVVDRAEKTPRAN
jgi:uncharacterized protein (TIGR03435 family)